MGKEGDKEFVIVQFKYNIEIIILFAKHLSYWIGTGSVADPDPGSDAFLTPGSRILDPKPISLRA